MKLVSVVPETLVIRVPDRPPQIAGPIEVINPPPNVVFEYGKPVEVPDSVGEFVLMRSGEEGLARVDGETEEAMEEALLEAKMRRVAHLEARINAFREGNATRKAAGLEVVLPGVEQRKWLRELKKLREELVGANAELLPPSTVSPAVATSGAATSGAPVSFEKIEDVAARDFEEFGIPASSASLVPGLEDFLMVEKDKAEKG